VGRAFEIPIPGIDVAGPAKIDGNRVNRFNVVLSDGGGIYMWRREGGVTVIRNTVTDGRGTRAGTPHASAMTHGIYLDDDTTGVAVSGNVVHRAGNFGLLLHNTRGISVTGNTFAQNAEAQVWLLDDSLGVERNTALVFRDNVLIDTDGRPSIAVGSNERGYDFAAIGEIDANRYCAPYGEPFVRLSAPELPAARRDTTLQEWRALGHDGSSATCPFALATFAETGRGPERVANGRFDTGIAGWNVFPGTGSIVRSTALGGSMQWGAGANAPGTDGNVSTAIGPVSAGQVFRVSWREYGAAGDARLRVFLMRNSTPWTIVTEVPRRFVSPSGGTFVQHLTANATHADARIAIAGDAGGLPVVIDDVSVVPVTGRTLTQDERLKLATNPASTARAVVLDAPRVDVRGTLHAAGSTVVVPPFGALPLFPSP